MASPQQPVSSGEQHQQGQAALNAAAVAALAGAWVLLDPTELAASMPAFQSAVGAVVTKYGQAAAAAAVTHYKVERAAAGVTSRFVPTMPPPVPVDAVDAAVAWATKDLWRPVADQDLPAAAVALDGAVQKLVADQGRHAVLGNVRADKQAKGWARVPHPDESLSGTCAFCLLLATRGAVYKSETSAKFQAHPGCNCTAEPQFSHQYEPTATVRAAQALYRDSTGDVRGMKAKQIAFRRAVEDRRSTAPLVPTRAPVPVGAELPPDAGRALAAKWEKSLATMRANNKNGSLDKTIAATEQRLAALRDALSVAA